MKNFDLNLCNWGPYNKIYLGVSNICNKEKGVRFDFNLFPGFYRRSVIAPKDICDNGTKIMRSSADLSHFLLRYELLWKDEVYIDADYLTDEKGDMNITLDVVNNTDVNQSITLNGTASVKFPTFLRKNLEICEVSDKSLWVDATEFSDILCREIIGTEGFEPSERRVNSFVNASGIYGKCFSDGDYIEYNVPTSASEVVYIRYTSEEDITLVIEKEGQKHSVQLSACETPSLKKIETEKNLKGKIKIYPSNGEYYIDGFYFGKTEPEFYDYTKDFIPEIKKEDKKITLKYRFGTYEITWNCDDYIIRELTGEDQGEILTNFIHNHIDDILKGNGEGHYLDLFIRPIFVNAHERKTIKIKIRRTDKDISGKVNNEFVEIPVNPDGEKYKFSQQIMTATTLTNVVFPTYIKGEYIRHSTPGRFWDCLYTWDSGFIGMGLNTVDDIRAKDNLNNYMTDLNDKSLFILRGSVVPTQLFLYQEIWNKNTDEGFLRELYPYMRRYYSFFIKILDEKTGMNKTWDFFYNSGGWDDYPPQQYIHKNNLTHKIYPVITSSLTVLFAKIMKNAAKKLGFLYDSYEADITRISASVRKNTWDEESGYYGYYDSEKEDILKFEDKVNFNMGFDGIYPYVAGISNSYERERIYDNIINGLMTGCGVSVVDTRAPYYSKKGYWNGSVWMPHQWVLWKALFDKGETELAKKIAFTALDLWKEEVELTYNCYEHFMIENKRGAGFHQFSGLSTPVLMWYKAYFSPGTVTTGFTTFIDNITKNEDCSYLSIEIKERTMDAFIMVCLNSSYDYEFFINGSIVEGFRVTDGAYCIKAIEGTLECIAGMRKNDSL